MRLLALLVCLFAASPAAAQLRAVPEQIGSEREALRGVEVFLVNETDAPLPAEGPREIEVTAADGTRLILERVPIPRGTVPPGGFVKARYVPVGIAGTAVPPAEQHAAAPPPPESETTVASSTGASSALVDRFEPHEPTYGVWGPGDAGAKLQLSFAFRPFAEDAPLKLGNLRFAYTQTMFWALDRPSGPFRSTNYSPEVYADIPLDETLKVALGYRHDSNGRGPAGSIDVNRIFFRVEKRVDLGNDWRLDIAPQAWFYTSTPGVAPNIADSYGYTSISASVQKADGIKISLTGRGNFETRRGAAELMVSYPLTRIGGLGLYVFGQAFTGHGEALDDWNRRTTHARIGFAFTR